MAFSLRDSVMRTAQRSIGWRRRDDGSGMFGAIAGVARAVIGTYAGHAARLAAIASIGNYPAAIVEDLVAIGLAAFIVTR